MPPCPDPSTLDAFSRGQLRAEEQATLEVHLDVCPECARVAATLAAIFLSGTSAGPPRRDVAGGAAPVAIGRYRIDAELGRGAMGTVYAARDTELGRQVAVKLLHADHGADLDAQREQLLCEAQAMARLSHPNVAAVYDVGRIGDRLFLAMELVHGTTLRQWLLAPERTRTDILAMFAQAGRGLAVAHAAGLVHRDFKPDNVLVGHDGRARVTDFGLARAFGPNDRNRASTDVLRPTGARALVGTPAYMAPEQLRGELARAPADQFAYGVALYEALFRARPFAGESARELVANVLDGRLRPLPSAPRWLRALLARALALDPADRYPSMDALLAELTRDHHRIGRLALSVGGMIAGASAIVLVMHAVTSGERPPDVRAAPTPAPEEPTAAAVAPPPETMPSSPAALLSAPASAVVTPVASAPRAVSLPRPPRLQAVPPTPRAPAPASQARDVPAPQGTAELSWERDRREELARERERRVYAH